MDPTRRSRRLAIKRGENVSPEPTPPPNSPKKLTKRTIKKFVRKSSSSSSSNTNTNNEAPGSLPAQHKPRVALPIIPRPQSARVATLREKAIIKARENGIARLRALHEATDALNFKRNNVFNLAGHGSAISPDTYKLQPHEYYTTPTLCGYIAYVAVQEHYDFVTHRHHIRIPMPSNASFWNSDVNTLFEDVTKQKPNYMQGNNNDHYIKEKGAYKMYVPFAGSAGSNTVRNTNIYPFTYWKISDVVLPTPQKFEFSYGDVIKTYDDLDDVFKFNIYRIAISGVLQSYKGYVKTEAALEENAPLIAASKYIVSYFNIPKHLINHRLFLYICVPRNYSDIRILSDSDADDPLIAYTRDAIKNVYLDSVVSLEALYGKDVTFSTIFTHSIPMSTLYPLIKATARIPDNEPMLLVNSLCRNYYGHRAPRNIYSNDNADPRSFSLASFKHTLRGQRLAKHVKLNTRQTIKSHVGRVAAFSKLAPATQQEILKSIVVKRKITHDMYAANPEMIAKYLVIVSGYTQKVWREFLAALPKTEFATP